MSCPTATALGLHVAQVARRRADAAPPATQAQVVRYLEDQVYAFGAYVDRAPAQVLRVVLDMQRQILAQDLELEVLRASVPALRVAS